LAAAATLIAAERGSLLLSDAASAPKATPRKSSKLGRRIAKKK
jgi:hypothetical protein